MRMACLGNHFPILIREDTKEDHERCNAFCGIPMVFLFKPKTIIAKMIVVDDLLAN
jgi:hypothetical protein